MVSGLDVSIKNGKVNWDFINSQQIRFVYIQTSEGVNTSNLYFEENAIQAKKKGIMVGTYHWFHPRMDVDNQVTFYLEISKNLGLDLPPAICLDLHKPVIANFSNDVQHFLESIEKKMGQAPIIYTSESYWKTYLPKEEWACDYSLWIDKPGNIWPSQLFPWSKWTYWQFHYQARIPGIEGLVGLNWFNGDYSELCDLVH